MILSNIAILEGINKGYFNISPLENQDPSQKPFNTSAIDLRLGSELIIPTVKSPVVLDLRMSGIANFLTQNSQKKVLSSDQPFRLNRNQFVLGITLETVSFPIFTNGPCFSARIEGKSSIARCGVLVHFTAPTIHAGFEGVITLEILNLGPHDFLLTPEMYICQLIVEEVRGCPINAPNQFSGQTGPAGITK